VGAVMGLAPKHAARSSARAAQQLGHGQGLTAEARARMIADGFTHLVVHPKMLPEWGDKPGIISTCFGEPILQTEAYWVWKLGPGPICPRSQGPMAPRAEVAP